MNKIKYINFLTPLVRSARRLGIIPASPLINDRAIEYGFMARELDFQRGQRILDVGFLESPCAFIFSGLGAEVYALDLRSCPIKYPNLKSVVGDIRKTDFEDKFFDRIVAISTIEHLGISTRYGSYEDLDADKKAMQEIKRILKNDGRIIVTVPFGKSSINSVQRTYNLEDIKKITEDFEVISIEYSKNAGSYWTIATHEEVKDTVGYNANVMVSLRK